MKDDDLDTSTLDQISQFGVPVYTHRVDDEGLNDELREAVLAERARSEGVSASNRGGWHSHRDLQDWSAPGVRRLLGHINTMLAQVVSQTADDPRPELLEGWQIRAWANVNTEGARNSSHTHFWSTRRTLWSGVYYVDPGTSSTGEDVEGQTVFEDRVGVPRELGADNDPFGHELVLTPEAGLMVLFPATLHHRVKPYRGDSERITIAWNLYHPAFAVPLYPDDGVRRVGVVLPAPWRRYGEMLKRVIPGADQRIEYSRAPLTVGEDWARSLDRLLERTSASPLRKPDDGPEADRS